MADVFSIHQFRGNIYVIDFLKNSLVTFNHTF